MSKIKKVLVTGAAGFIGSHLVEKLLEKKFKVKALVRYNSTSNINWLNQITYKNQNLKIIFGDITDPDSIEEAVSGCDAVINLAAMISVPYSFKNPQSFIDTNIYGTYMVCKYAVDTNVKHLLYTSSVAVYGSANGNVLTEKNIIKPDSIYGISKYSGEMYIRLLTKNSNTKHTIFRVFNTYGPGENLNYNKKGMVSIYASYLWKNEPIKVKGSIERYRDFTFIDDSIDGLVTALFNSASFDEIFNLTSGEKVIIKDLIELMKITAGKNNNYPINIIDSTPGDSFGFNGSNKKIKRLLGWSPNYNLEKGLNNYFNWINKVPINNELSNYHPFKLL